MNEHVPHTRPTTQAADGLPRWRWTVSEIFRLIESGVLRESDRFELLGGEIVPMSPKGARHELVKNSLVLFLARALPEDLSLAVETTLYIAGTETFFEPDLMIWPKRIPRDDITDDVPPSEISLLIEVAGSSIAYDKGAKAGHYARLGVRDYWVIDANTLTTTTYREASPAGFQQIETFAFEQLVTPLLVPALAMRLADLGLEPAR